MPCMSTGNRIWDFLKVRKKFWLLPFMLIVLLVGGLLVAAIGSGDVSFRYTLF